MLIEPTAQPIDWQLWMNVAGLIVGITGTGFGVTGFLNQRSSKKREAATRLELITQKLLTDLIEISGRVFETQRLIRDDRWREAIDFSTKVQEYISVAIGAWSKRIMAGSEEKLLLSAYDKMNGITRQLQEAGPNGLRETKQEMLQQLQETLDSIASIKGAVGARLQLKDIISRGTTNG